MAAPPHIVVTVLLAAWAGPASVASWIPLDRSLQPELGERAGALCDGTPPELNNKDDRDYDYELLCGQKTEKRSIAAHSKQSLKNKSGCALKLADNQPTKLYADMVCTIESAKLTCNLL